MALAFAVRRSTRVAEASELDVLRATVAELRRVCEAAVEGDSEARAQHIPGAENLADAEAARHALNDVLDRTDAFAREVGGALIGISEKRFYRRVLLSGMHGLFRTGAIAINSARDAMIEAERRAHEAEQTRHELADRLESTVMAVAEQVAAASTELSATAANLSTAATHAVTQADSAGSTMGRLDEASREIQAVVSLISSVAAQTKLLALNATIEAARAGDSGRGFGVVAAEVKTLAETTAKSTEQITAQVAAMLDAATQSKSAMGSIEITVRDMSPMVDDLLIAVDGSRGHSGHVAVSHGLAEMAEMLRGEVGTFLAVMRET
jgi:methyl-accepting chemotaxis protein